jgi:hypothetical protein
MVNFRNVPLVEWVAIHGADVGIDVSAAVRTMFTGFTAVLTEFKPSRDIIARNLPLDASQRSALLEAMLEDLDVESFAFFSDAWRDKEGPKG